MYTPGAVRRRRGVGTLERVCTLPSLLGGLGSVGTSVTSPRGVYGKTPAAGVFFFVLWRN